MGGVVGSMATTGEYSTDSSRTKKAYVSLKFDNVSEPRHRKLYAMGLAALVSTGRPEVLERLPTEVFDLWTDVFAELKEVQKQKDNEFGEET